MQQLFSDSFQKGKPGGKYLEINAIYKNLKAIDELIAKAAPQFPVEKINKIDLSILRLAVYELDIAKKVPFKVVIDEAIELAKEFGSASSSSFINGALGNIHNKISK